MPLWPQVAQRRLVGARPKPVSSGQHGPKCQRRFAPCFHNLTLLFLLSSRFSVAHQIVNVRLDRDDLLHIPSCLLIFPIELFFLCCKLTAFFLQHISVNEARSLKQTSIVALSSRTRCTFLAMVFSLDNAIRTLLQSHNYN